MPSLAEVAELRANAFADDMELRDEMCDWTEDEITAYFESGGEVCPEKKAEEPPAEPPAAAPPVVADISDSVAPPAMAPPTPPEPEVSSPDGVLT